MNKNIKLVNLEIEKTKGELQILNTKITLWGSFVIGLALLWFAIINYANIEIIRIHFNFTLFITLFCVFGGLYIYLFVLLSKIYKIKDKINAQYKQKQTLIQETKEE